MSISPDHYFSDNKDTLFEFPSSGIMYACMQLIFQVESFFIYFSVNVVYVPDEPRQGAQLESERSIGKNLI